MAKKLIEIDKVLWNKFRKKCVNNDLLIRDVLPVLIKDYVERQ